MSRPDWDSYFIGVMDAISKRSTCDRGMCGCVFVRDKQILITGYAGAAPKFPHCDEIGHVYHEKTKFINAQDFELNNPDIIEHYASQGYINVNLEKKRFEMKSTIHCENTVHAEQAAIAQAAKTGVILKGSTVYVKFTPCKVCTNLLISIEIERVVCSKKYQAGGESEEMLKQAGIILDFVSTEIQEYPDKK